MGILLNYFSHKKFRYHQRKVILFYTLDFAFCSCKIKFKKNEEGEKRITRAVAMQKMPPPTSILSPMIRLRFGELSTPCVRTFVIRTTLFSAFMSAKDKTQYKLIARPE